MGILLVSISTRKSLWTIANKFFRRFQCFRIEFVTYCMRVRSYLCVVGDTYLNCVFLPNPGTGPWTRSSRAARLPGRQPRAPWRWSVPADTTRRSARSSTISFPAHNHGLPRGIVRQGRPIAGSKTRDNNTGKPVGNRGRRLFGSSWCSRRPRAFDEPIYRKCIFRGARLETSRRWKNVSVKTSSFKLTFET